MPLKMKMGKRNNIPRKDIKKRAHTVANIHKDDSGSMMSIAMDGKQEIYAHSGKPANVSTATDPYPTYLIELNSELPWNGLTAVLPRNHNTCAEAHLWCELKARSKNPLNYTLVSFNTNGIIASPCANCAQWVESAFGAVYKETPAYEGRSKQKP